jgi:hypothetical protein
MDDCRVLRLRACAVAQPTEAARLNAEVDAVLAARAVGLGATALVLAASATGGVLHMEQHPRRAASWATGAKALGGDHAEEAELVQEPDGAEP